MRNNSTEASKRVVGLFHNPVTAWVILGISLCLTVVAYKISNKFVIERAADRFYFRANEIEKAIEDRLRVYEQQLWSGVGLIYASENITRESFAKFVETMNIDEHWPGIQGFGFSVPVEPEEKQSHIEAIRAEGFPQYKIYPEGKRDLYSAIIYLEPFDWRNKRAFGYDMWSNDIRREAMARARDEGVAATSGIITLVQETDEDVQPGFLTYVPVYEGKEIPSTVAERREKFAGWVYAPYRAGNLMKGIIGTEDPNIDFEVYDGKNMNEETLLFDSNDRIHLKEAQYKPQFQKTTQVMNQGRLWTIHFETPQNYMSLVEVNRPRFIAVFGVIIDLLLFYVIYSIYFLQRKAFSMAKEMTQEIESRTQELENTKNSLEAKVKERTRELEQARINLERKVSKRTKELESRMEELEQMNKAMIGRENRMAELKEENERLKKGREES